MKNVAFQFKKYWFEEASLYMNNASNDGKLDIDFSPSGIYQKEKGLYKLVFVFTAWDEKKSIDDYCVKVKCNAEFQFANTIDFSDIPLFFFPNSIAIVYPYIRAFVSTMTLQANYPVLVLPTTNLSALQEKLRNNTEVI